MTLQEAKQILGLIQVVVTVDDLKKAYKKSILCWHPDLAVKKGISVEAATAKSTDINLAYEILSKNLVPNEQSTFKYNYKTPSSKSHKQYYDNSIDSIDEKFLNRVILKSSNVKWVDYIKDLAVLVVRFKNSSGYYLYYDVPESVFLKFQTAESPGRFVHQYLREYKYESHYSYADWLNIYTSLSDITNDY